jgi:hypothetical protein
MNESNLLTLDCPASGWEPSEWADPSTGPGLVGVSSRTNGAIIAAVLSFLACVSNGSPPPAPGPEASSDGRAHESTVAPKLTPQPAQASPSPASNSPAPATELSRELSALPDSVLVGTDVVPLAEYLASAAPIPPSGTFRSEQGGATAEVKLAPGPQGVTLTREFTEPGAKALTKRYDALQALANGVRLSSANLEVLGTRQSLLVLEKRSGVDGIPDSLWIEYERPGAGSPAKGE